MSVFIINTILVFLMFGMVYALKGQMEELEEKYQNRKRLRNEVKKSFR